VYTVHSGATEQQIWHKKLTRLAEFWQPTIRKRRNNFSRQLATGI